MYSPRTYMKDRSDPFWLAVHWASPTPEIGDGSSECVARTALLCAPSSDSWAAFQLRIHVMGRPSFPEVFLVKEFPLAAHHLHSFGLWRDSSYMEEG